MASSSNMCDKCGEPFSLCKCVTTVTEEQVNKYKFIANLGHLLAKYDIADIIGMTYMADKEEVHIYYLGGGSRTINVNMDSPTAMLVDIVKQGGLG